MNAGTTRPSTLDTALEVTTTTSPSSIHGAAAAIAPARSSPGRKSGSPTTGMTRTSPGTSPRAPVPADRPVPAASRPAVVVSAGPVVSGELEIRQDRFQAFVSGGSVDLTRREFELLELLAGAEGRVLERDDIYRRVWGYEMARGDRSVDVFVRKLRQKLEKASPQWRYIHTHFGVGYRFAAESADGAVDAPVAAPAPAHSAAPVREAAPEYEHSF